MIHRFFSIFNSVRPLPSGLSHELNINTFCFLLSCCNFPSESREYSCFFFSLHHQFTSKRWPFYFILVKLFWEPSIPTDLNQFNSVSLRAHFLSVYLFLTNASPLLPPSFSLMDWCQDNIKALLIPWHGIPAVLLTFTILKQGKCLLGRCTWGQAFSVTLMSGNWALTTLCAVNGYHSFCRIHLQHSFHASLCFYILEL